MSETSGQRASRSQSSRSSQSTRSVTSLTQGSKLMVLVALLLVVYAIYLALSPITRIEANKTVDCGTVINPPATDFVAGLCGKSTDARVAQVAATGAMALLVAGGGIMIFGTTRTESEGRRSPSED